jgi:hypothetical protein
MSIHFETFLDRKLPYLPMWVHTIFQNPSCLLSGIKASERRERKSHLIVATYVLNAGAHTLLRTKL